MNFLNLLKRDKYLFVDDISNHNEELNEIVRKSSFLVLGGAGSIGQAVSKEIFKRSPKKLHVVDISENNLVELVRDIRSAFGYTKGEFKTFAIDIGSVEYDVFIKNDVKELKKYIDIDYCASLNAFRVIYGSDGHGFSNENLEMSYDTISHLINPIVHRDDNSSSLANCLYPYTFMDSTKEIIPFWLILDKDSDFLKITNQKIDEFLLKNNVSSLYSEFDDLINYYKSSHVFAFSYMNNGMNGNSILENAECLENLFNKN
jgi:hypothetical protein